MMRRPQTAQGRMVLSSTPVVRLLRGTPTGRVVPIVGGPQVRQGLLRLPKFGGATRPGARPGPDAPSRVAIPGGTIPGGSAAATGPPAGPPSRGRAGTQTPPAAPAHRATLAAPAAVDPP